MKTQFIALGLLLCVAVASAISLRQAQGEFVKFQRKYKKAYDAAEFQERFQIFKRNLEIAEELNAKNPKAQFGATKFSDLSSEEFASLYLMPKGTFEKFRNQPKKYNAVQLPRFRSEKYPMGPDPNNWDWSQQGATTPVYNQGQCGSCWAFSATETIESYFFLAGNSLTQLSMEQIVDCDTNGQDQGCNGGFPSGAYQYVQGAGGLDSYSSYPYTAGNGTAGSCAFSQNSLVATVTGYTSVNGESGLYQTASTSGPVSVCVDASSWQNYQGGVLSSCTDNIDHCVQLTGYANANGGALSGYWIVRNSWGADWGESGFIWVQQGSDLCGIGDEATVVTATSA